MTHRNRRPVVMLCLLGLFLAGWGLPTVARGDAAEDSYQFAAGLYKKERWDLAADGFRKFLKDFPKDQRAPSARFFLGLSLINGGEYKAAHDTLKQFLSEAPNSRNAGHAAYRIAEASYLLDDWAQAETELTAYVSKYPEDALVERALPYLGDVQLRTRKFDEALQTFQESLRKFPMGPMAEDCEFGIARCYEARQQYDQALALYTKLAERPTSPRAAEARLNLGNRLYDQQKFQDAVAAFNKLQQDFPESPLVGVARLNQGFSLFELKQFEPASQQFELAAKDPKQAVEATYWRGQCLDKLGQPAVAAGILSELYTQHAEHPLAPRILYGLAEAEQHQGHYPPAQQRYTELVTRFPKHELADDALQAATACALETGNLADVEKLLQQFTQNFPESPLRPAQDLIGGRVRIIKGEAATALPIFQQILVGAASPATKKSARYYTAFAHLELGQYPEALAATETLIDPSDPMAVGKEFASVYLVRGAAQLALGNKEPVANTQREIYLSAIESASAFLALHPQGKDADQGLSLRALASAHAGLKDRAKSDVERLQKDYATSPEMAKTLYEVAEIAYSNDDWEWSGQLFATLTGMGAESKFFVPGLSGQAWSLFKQKQYGPAGEQFARLVKESPDHKDAPEASFMQGKSLQNAGMGAEAVAVFSSTLQKYPTSKFAYLAGLEAARLHRDAQAYPQADQAYAAVLEKFPKPDHLDKVLNEWALVNLEGQNFKRADEVFTRLIQETPDSDLVDNARLNLAESDLVGGRLDKARQQFQQIEQDPKSDLGVQQTALYQLVVIGLEQSDWNAVKTATASALKRFPDGTYHWFHEFASAEADLNSMAVPQAIEKLKRVLAAKEDPMVAAATWFGKAWVLLAEAQLREKDHESVAATVAAAHQWKPDAPILYVIDEIAGRSLKAQARFPEAIEAFQRVIQYPNGARTETAAKAQFMIGETLVLQGKFKEAEAAFLNVDILYQFPDWQAPALFQAGSCEEELKNWKAAEATYADLLKRFPKSEYAKMAADRLPRVRQRLK